MCRLGLSCGRRWGSNSHCAVSRCLSAHVKKCTVCWNAKKQLALARLAVGPAKGVPSLFSPERVFEVVVPFAYNVSSRVVGLALKSVYFLQFRPQESQRIEVARPFGAFHHCRDSRVRQAAQYVVERPALVGTLTIDESSSSDCGAFPVDSSSVRVTLLLLYALGSRSLSFSSRNRPLYRMLVVIALKKPQSRSTDFFQCP